MKKLVLALTMLFLAAGAVFAQSDLQALAVVKLNKSESITLKQLKSRCVVYEKQLGRAITAEERKLVLDALIEEKLLVQAGTKAGISIPDSTVDQYFIQSFGVNATEKELQEYVEKNLNKSFDDYILEQSGMNKADFKAYLKNSLIIQQYVAQVSQSELAQLSPTDDQIRLAYESNKSSFVWNDMIKVMFVLIPKKGNLEVERAKANEIRNNYIDKKLTTSQLLLQQQQTDAGYGAAEGFLAKTEESAQQAGMTLQNLITFFEFPEGSATNIEEYDTDFRFAILEKKYSAKMLSISDIVQPDTTVTVYEYIRSMLTQQLQASYLNQQIQVVSKSLNTSDNVEYKKTGAALDKLLAWE